MSHSVPVGVFLGPPPFGSLLQVTNGDGVGVAVSVSLSLSLSVSVSVSVCVCVCPCQCLCRCLCLCLVLGPPLVESQGSQPASFSDSRY